MSGRIADLAVYEANPAIYYVGTAHGGVWKTVEQRRDVRGAVPGHGADFDRRRHGLAEGSRPRLGRRAASRTTARARRGATASTSRPTAARPGSTWVCRKSKHINRIVIDPTNNNIVFVAATGALFGPGGERGVYKTTDGGAHLEAGAQGRRRHGRERPRDGRRPIAEHHVRVDVPAAPHRSAA